LYQHRPSKRPTWFKLPRYERVCSSRPSWLAARPETDFKERSKKRCTKTVEIGLSDYEHAGSREAPES
jgi:hypothetical protein